MFGKIVSYCFKVLLLTVCFAAVAWYFFLPKNQEDYSYVSPLPEFLTLAKNKQATLLDFWFPFIQKTQANEFDESKISAKSVLMYDLTTNKTLYERDSTTRRPMASITKIMTAIISLENRPRQNRYVVHADNLVGEDSMGLTSGEVLTLEDLLYGLMLPSGNDAAEVLASNSPLGRQGFIKAMNDKAKSLGLTDTSYSNPSGLQGDGVQYTTAADLLVITRYALDTFPIFAKIVSTPEHDIIETTNHKAYHLANETNLLTTYPGVRGVKTGYTPEAGLCLVTYLDYSGHKIIGIVLASENRRGEMKELLDYSLHSIGIDPPAYTGG